jgi:hypothetical protein
LVAISVRLFDGAVQLAELVGLSEYPAPVTFLLRKVLFDPIVLRGPCCLSLPPSQERKLAFNENRHAAALALLAIIAFSPIRAFGDSAEELYSACKSIAEAKVEGERVFLPQTFQAGECWSAFSALQTLTRYVDPQSRRPWLGEVCVPSQATRSEIVAVFTKYVRDHPERRHDDFVEVALDSFRAAFCKSTR